MPTCDIRRPVGAIPAVDDGPPAAQLRLELDLDVALDRRHEPRPDHVRHDDRIVDRRALPAVRLAVVDREEVDELGHERARRARGAQALQQRRAS